MAPAIFHGFFDLPGELREQILTYLLVQPDGIHINTHSRLELLAETSPERRTESQPLSSLEDSDDDDDDDEPDEPGWPLNYFLASQALHREASAVFFGENEFHMYAMAGRMYLRDHEGSAGKDRGRKGQGLDWKGGGGVRGRRREYGHLESLRRVRRAVLHVQRLGGVLEGVFVPLLGEMALAGRMRSLEVRVYLVAGTGTGQGARGAEGVWGSRVGRGLVGLLRDPDLDVARLRMLIGMVPGDGGEVAGAWCLCRGEGGAGGRGLLTMMDREGRVWCDVDVGELARRYGGEEVGIFKVEERSMLRWAGV